MEPVFNALQSVDPIFALVAGVALGAVTTLAVVFWKPRSTPKADPLSNLFAGDTLQSQIARVADHDARSERADRDASAIRAKLFARKAGKAAPIPPHRAERYDHAAVLDHIAKVMRAGSELGNEPQLGGADKDAKDEGQWEEVLLLPAPASSATSQKAA